LYLVVYNKFLLIKFDDDDDDDDYILGHFIFRLNLSFKPNRNLNA